MKLNISKSKQAVAEEFAKYFADFVSSRKEAHIALSGGSTPKIVFDELAKNYKTKIDWSKVYLYWGDERCVPPEDDDSNYKMTKNHLLSKIDIPEANVHRIKGENKPEYEANRYAELLFAGLRNLRKIPHFDMVILGIGDDGHTASIFPHEIHLWNSDRNCEIGEHPESGQKRITITGRVINNAQKVVFLVTGENKAKRVEEIIYGYEIAESYPVSLVSDEHARLVWFMDEAAAQNLKPRPV